VMTTPAAAGSAVIASVIPATRAVNFLIAIALLVLVAF